MNEIKQCAELYQQLLDKEYRISVAATSNTQAMTLRLNFGAEHFHHLLGISKLQDLPYISRANRANFFKQVLNGQITQSQLLESSFFPDIAPRLEYFDQYIDVMKNEIVLDFDKRKAFNCKIDSNLLFFKKLDSTYVYSFFKSDDTGIYVPVTFFQNKSRSYADRQKVWKILNVEVVDKPPEQARREKQLPSSKHSINERLHLAEIQLAEQKKMMEPHFKKSALKDEPGR